MKSRAILLLLAALIVAGVTLAFRAARAPEDQGADFTAVTREKPSKPGSANRTLLHDERYPELDPALTRIVHRLEAELEEWQGKRPPYIHPALHRKEWQEFTRAKIGQLQTEQIAALAAALDRAEEPGGMVDYVEAIYFVWGSRDHAAARAHILQAAAEGLPNWAGYTTSMPGSVFSNLESYRIANLGFASSHPQEAWDVFLADKDDPAATGSLETRTLLYDVFKAYSGALPREALRLYQGEQDPDTRRDMFYGYVTGAPAGQDWEMLSGEFDRLAALGKSPEPDEFTTRWVVEEPERALEWFAAHVDREDFKRTHPFFSGDEPQDFDSRMKMLVLGELYHSTEYRLPEAVAVLQQLAGGADEALAARAVSQFIGGTMSPSYGLPLLAVIPRFRSSQFREELFLQAARAVPSREFTTEHYPAGLSFDYPNVCLDAVRALAAEMELPDEVRQQGEAALRQVEAQEAECQRNSRGQ